MKLAGFEDIDPAVRAFILIVVAIAYPAWDFGFEIGAFGRLFYEKIFVAWSISTALFVVLLVSLRTEARIHSGIYVILGLFPKTSKADSAIS